jgi:VanZ family protein
MKAFFRTLPLIGMMAVIFLLSQQPGNTLPLPSFFGADKLAHFLVYGLLAAAALHTSNFFLKDRLKPGSVGLLVVVFCLLYGVSDEYHQSFVPLRSVSAGDVLADGIGALCTVLWWLRTSQPTKTSAP